MPFLINNLKTKMQKKILHHCTCIVHVQENMPSCYGFDIPKLNE